MPPESIDSPTAHVPGQRTRPAGDRVDDSELLGLLRAGDEDTFRDIVDRWSPVMLRVARAHVSTDASAQEIVQEAWLGVIKGIDRFEGRSSVRTWVFRILTNLAKTRGVREARSVPWSSLGPEDTEGPTVDPSRFRGPDDEWPSHWTPAGAPVPFPESPEGSLVAKEVRELLADALVELPERQRIVVSLRDVHGLDSDEVCEVLGLSAANQRVLLHRGRAKLRALLESYYRGHEEGVL